MIYEKLQQSRIELQSKKLKKSGKNKFAGFTYYELNDILPQINQIFYDLKLFSNFSIKENLAVLTITDWEDETFQEFTSPIEELELKGCTKIQALGGVHTYMKRYLYLNALEIVESDMLDAKAGDIEEPVYKASTPINKPAKIMETVTETEDEEEIFALISGYKTVEGLVKHFNHYKNKVTAIEEFKTLCGERKKEILGGKQ